MLSLLVEKNKKKNNFILQLTTNYITEIASRINLMIMFLREEQMHHKFNWSKTKWIFKLYYLHSIFIH